MNSCLLPILDRNAVLLVKWQSLITIYYEKILKKVSNTAKIRKKVKEQLYRRSSKYMDVCGKMFRSFKLYFLSFFTLRIEPAY